jgi:hypothetical protein
MRELWALFVILAIAISVGIAGRHPVPLRPIEHQQPQNSDVGSGEQHTTDPRYPSTTTHIPERAHFSTPQNKTHSEPSGSSQLDHTEDNPKWTDIIQGVSAFFVMILTAVLAGINYIQTGHIARSTKAAEDAAKIAEAALINTERAFIYLEGLEVTFERSRYSQIGVAKRDLSGQLVIGDYEITQWRIHAIWANSGSTPANRLITNWACKQTPSDLPREFDFPYTNVGQHQFISPRGHVRGDFMPLPGTYLGKIKTNTSYRVFVWGFADYDDVFPDTPRHRTEFCFYAQWAGIDSEGLPRIAWIAYPRHNGADDECSRAPEPYEPPKKT